MKFAIQMGYGLQQAAIDLARDLGGSTIVVSPRVFRVREGTSIEESMIKYCHRISSHANTVLIDPLLYTPKNLLRQTTATKYASNVILEGRAGYVHAVQEILQLNDTCDTSVAILPSWTIGEPDSQWAQFQETASKEALANDYERPAYTTIALTADFLKESKSIDWIARNTERWDSPGVFLALEHPNNDYLSDEPLWLLNALCLIATLKRMGKKVILGYASHQFLIAALAKCDYLCSGNFLNVRRFYTKDFEKRDNQNPSRRTKWYYAPHTLSEYKVTSLDLAYGMGILESLQSPYDDKYDEMLFSGALPSATAYSESLSHKHYLYSLHHQCAQIPTTTYQEAYDSCTMLVRTAQFMNEGLRKRGIDDANRSFANAFQACDQAMKAFNSKMGFIMGQLWKTI